MYVAKHAGTLDAIVDEKMKVLEELCVVNGGNYNSIRAELVSEIKKYPDADMQVVVDRIAKSMIRNAFN